jgi:pimeloyl-ACP methyl ester carboxylesterase
MSSFRSFDGLTLAYTDDGDGRPVVLLHGMGADSRTNFDDTGVVGALRAAGHRVVTLDMRGHGASAPVDDPDRFEDDAVVLDAVALLDHLDVGEAIVVGYSMSGFVALRLAARDSRVIAIVLIGIGEDIGKMDGPPETRSRFVEMIEAADPTDPRTPPEFRLPAHVRPTIVAYMKAHLPDTRDVLDEIRVPAVLVVGEREKNAGDPSILARRIHARLVRVPGSHFTTLAKPELHAAVVEFVNNV